MMKIVFKILFEYLCIMLSAAGPPGAQAGWLHAADRGPGSILYMCIYIYIYIYTYVCIYIYIYMYIYVHITLI